MLGAVVLARYQQAAINSSENKLRLMDNLDKHQKDLATTPHLFMSNFYSLFNGLLPKSLFAGSETFFNKSKARCMRFQNSPFGLKQLESLFFHFAKIYE